MKKLTISLMLVVAALCGCMPSTTVRTVDTRPTLAFKGAPEGAVLIIDGLNMGAVGQYDGDPKTLAVEPGTHTIRVMSGSTVLFEQRVFVEDSLKTISIR